MFLFIIIFYLLYYILYLLFSIFVYILLINSMVLKKQYNYSAVLGKNTPVFSRMYLIKYFKYQGHMWQPLMSKLLLMTLRVILTLRVRYNNP